MPADPSSAPDLTRKRATAHTAARNTRATLPPDDGDGERVRRGLIATHPTGRIDSGIGAVYDANRYAFLDADAPDTVHPSLWRHAQRNAVHGLFEVAPGVWQARGYDIANITFVAGSSGWIVIDPLTGAESARACLAMADEHLGVRPVCAVIYTRSHLDHFGGVLGVVSREDVAAGRCRVIAPAGFLHEAVSENLLAGPAMSRRSLYQFGVLLPSDPQGHVDCGLGKTLAIGSSLVAPTEDITHTGQELVVDGVRIVFQLTPETEAPAEMNFFFPDHGWLCMAENCTQTMHNLVPIRGAKVRDALAWSKYIDDALELFGDRAELCFASHNWPRWGRDDVADYLRVQRDLYRWMHDQTLRQANHGLVPDEIAETLELPTEFLAHGHSRGYYGDLVHNAKAVYQRYLSWYDGNPARLHRHPPTEVGRRYVACLGGAAALLAHAHTAFADGDYRWVVELCSHAVFADPADDAARAVLADAHEQLGYQAESSTFRNAHLTAAAELRAGAPKVRRPHGTAQFVDALTTSQVFDLLAVRLQSEHLAGVQGTLWWHVTDVDEQWRVELSNRTLHARRVAAPDDVPSEPRHVPSARVACARAELLGLLTAPESLREALAAGVITCDGDAPLLHALFDHVDVFLTGFAVVEP